MLLMVMATIAIGFRITREYFEINDTRVLMNFFI